MEFNSGFKGLMHYLSPVYFFNEPLQVSGVFVAHHQDVYCIHTTKSSIPTRSKDSKLKSTTCTNCCIFTVYHLMMGYRYARNT